MKNHSRFISTGAKTVLQPQHLVSSIVKNKGEEVVKRAKRIFTQKRVLYNVSFSWSFNRWSVYFVFLKLVC